MIRQLFCLGVLILWLTSAANVGAQRPQSAASPLIQVQPDFIELGKITQGQQPRLQYVIKNHGKGELVVGPPEDGCSCTSITVEKNRLAPGESTKLNVTFLSSGRQGVQDRFLMIPSNDRTNPIVSVRFHATISAELEFTPPSTIIWGATPGESVTSHTLSIEARMPVPLEISNLAVKDVKRSSGTIPPRDLTIKASIIRREVIQPSSPGNPSSATLTRVTIAFVRQPTTYTGPLQKMVEFNTNNRFMPKVTRTLYGTVVGDLTATPDHMDFGYDMKEGRWDRAITLKSRGQKAFTVVSVDTSGLSLQWKATPGTEPGTQRIDFKMTPPKAPSERISTKIHIKVDQGGQKEIPISVTCK